MPLALQAKVLRALQSRKFTKVGDHKNMYEFKGRVVASTNRDLKADKILEILFYCSVLMRCQLFADLIAIIFVIIPALIEATAPGRPAATSQ
jgi:transcriptional regulator with AAA-type ATPase domain